MMLRQLRAARRLGGLAASLPRAGEPLDALRAGCEPASWREAAARRALWGEGYGRSAATLALGAARGFCAAASDGAQSLVQRGSGSEAVLARESAALNGSGGDAGLAAQAAVAAPAPARAKRAPRVGVLNEKTASGRPKPDVRTVARLVELGWWATAEEAEAALTRRGTPQRFPFETAAPVIGWLVDTLGKEEHSGRRCYAAHAVFKFPLILTRSTSLLQRGWETVVLPLEDGGLGLEEAPARRRVASRPQVLTFSREFMLKRAAFLETLGVPDGRAAIARNVVLLGSSEDRLQKGSRFLRSQGLDVERMLSDQPTLLSLSQELLLEKLDFLRSVVGLDNSEISARLLVASLENVLRPRYFYALQRGAVHTPDYNFESLLKRVDADFVKTVGGFARGVHPSAEEMAAYRAHIASPAFCAYMDEQERQIRARGPSNASSEAPSGAKD